jgi:hypothetical protein
MGKTLSVRVRGRVAAIVAVVVAVAVPVAGQSSAAPPGAPISSTASRTADGHPDLQGVWFFGTLTPLERPADLAGRTHLNDEEIAAIEKRAASRPESFGLFGDHSKYVFDKRTSLIVDPADGKVPARTPAGEKRQAVLDAARRAAENPEDLPVYERCILGFNAGPPIIPGGYNQNIQLFQTRDYVVIHNEMNHNSRIVPLDGRPHLPTHLRQWNGDSRGRWEGDTLVVTTTNFMSTGTGTLMLDGNRARPGIGWSPDENLTLVERFKLADSDTLIYEFTITDPTVWTKPWTVSLPMTRSDEPLYEYACHEGNYGMRNILSGARAAEKAGGVATKTGSNGNRD